MAELPFYTNWSYAHPRAIELAAKVAELAPGDLNRVFFVSGGSEANEAIIKLVTPVPPAAGQPPPLQDDRAPHRLPRHHPGRALADRHLPAEDAVRAADAGRPPRLQHQPLPPSPTARPRQEFTQFLLDELRDVIEQEGPDSVAAVFMEPVQNSGGTFTPPEGYYQGVRAICDEYGMLLVADEVICGFGRLGEWFGSTRYDIRPDIVTFAKGVGSAHVPLGGVLMTDNVAAPFLEGHDHAQPRHHLRRPPRVGGRGAQEPRGDGARGRARQRAAQRVVLPGAAREAGRKADRGRRPRRRLLPVAGAGQGQGHQGDVQRRGVRPPAARLPVGTAVGRGADLPRRTTAATR